MDKILTAAAVTALFGLYWIATFIAEHSRQILTTLAILAAIAAAAAIYRTAIWRYWNIGTVTSYSAPIPAAGRRPAPGAHRRQTPRTAVWFDASTTA